MIECVTHLGDKKLIQKEKLSFRPSVYGIIVNDGKALLLNTVHTGTYSLPGGGIEIGESIENALKRELKEETGIEVELIRFYKFQEQFFYYDPADVAFHCFLFFYICSPKSLEVCKDSEVDDESVERPRWVEISGLESEHFHNHGQLILEALHSL